MRRLPSPTTTTLALALAALLAACKPAQEAAAPAAPEPPRSVASEQGEARLTVVARGPEEFAAAYRKDMPVWERLVKVSGATLD